MVRGGPIACDGEVHLNWLACCWSWFVEVEKLNLGCDVGAGVVICTSGGLQAPIDVETDVEVVERERGAFKGLTKEAVVGVFQTALANG